MTNEPSRESASGSTSPDQITFVGLADFVRRNLLLICGVALAVGLATALITAVVVPPRYEASVTLVVVSPPLSSELRPATLSVQAYQKILESDAVVAEARRRLVEKGELDPGARLRLGRELETRIFVSRRAEETALAPLLQAVARSSTAEQAAAIANAWAEVFLERTRELTAGTTSSGFQFVEQQYPVAKRDVEALEDARVTAANAFQRRADEASSRWDERLKAFKAETSDLIASQKAETRRLLESSAGELNIETREVQLTSLRTAYADLQNEQARVRGQLDQKTLELQALQRQIGETPQFLTLQKAITDDALWRVTGTEKGQPADWQTLQDRVLQTQEVNPVYTGLATRLSLLETEVNALTPRAAQLAERLTEMSTELQRLVRVVGNDRAVIEGLTREREAGLEKLNDDRATRLAELTRQRQQELDAIERERTSRLGQLDRDIAQQAALLSKLAEDFNEVLLAKAQQDVEDIRLGAAAVPPAQPQPRNSLLKSLLAATLAGLLALVAAMLRDAARAA